MTDEELIAELERAEEGAKELHVKIWEAVGLSEAEEQHCAQWCRMDGRTDLKREHFIAAWAPKFTSNVQDILDRLIPNGCQWEVRSVPTDEGINHSAVVNWMPDGRQYAATPALALCAAALKARKQNVE